MKTAKKIQLLPKARGQRDTKADNHAMIRSLQINVYKERPFELLSRIYMAIIIS